eukprot:355214-Chlamydomonas_euryale.AAC.2
MASCMDVQTHVQHAMASQNGSIGHADILSCPCVVANFVRTTRMWAVGVLDGNRWRLTWGSVPRLV